METIRFEELSFKYPLKDEKALDNISFGVKPSEFIVVCGKSGCGKSTMLRHIKKTMIPYGERTGNVYFCEKKIEEMDQRTSVVKIGFVQQNPDNQIVTDKVWHELAFGMESLGIENRAIKRRVAEMANYFGIHRWFRKNVSELSGGQKQLLNLASVMAMQPEVLVLDEPTSQLDPIAASEFLRTIHKINRDLGVTVMLSEHRLEEAFTMADRVMVMDKGKIAAYDTPRNIGKILIERKHPMFYGLPAIIRILQDNVGQEDCPLTVREGRLWMENNLDEANLKLAEALPGQTQVSKEENAISIKDLWFRYDKKGEDILRGLNLNVKRGQLYCLLGGNGAGKSTVLKALIGIIKPQHGKCNTNGYLAMVPQNPQAIFTEITAEEELFEAFVQSKLTDKEKVEEVEKMLEVMEIEHLKKANPYDLSGGEQQRLAIGKVLLCKPDILLLDEPTKGLDPFFKRTLAAVLKKLTKKNMTILMVSHDVEFCAEYADSCSIFFDGEIIAEAEPRSFFAGNSFYTTTANQIVRKWAPDLVKCEEVRQWLKSVRR